MVTGEFPLVEYYLSTRLDIDISSVAPGQIAVVETPQRLRREQSYGYIRAFWWLRLEDGRSVVSVPPGMGEDIAALLENADDIHNPDLLIQLQHVVNAALCSAELPTRVFRDLCFACNASLLRQHENGDCRQLTDDRIPPADGLDLPTHCFPDGIVYGVVTDGRVASVAYAHATGVMAGEVADLGVVTAPAYRRCGYAKTVVSAVMAHVAASGGEGYYCCDPGNMASQALARSVGFIPFGASLILTAPWDGL